MASKTRKDRFTIRTKKMSDEMYEFLDAKIARHQLADYLIELVERDMKNEPMLLDFKKVSEDIQNLRKQFERIDKIQYRPDSNQQLNKSLVSLENTDAEITGKIDEGIPDF